MPQSKKKHVMEMIEAAQTKLREAKYFLSCLDAENSRRTRGNTEVFGFYLSAFVSAARSVTFAMQKEEKDKYDLWFSGWRESLPQEDRKLCGFMVNYRNSEQKQGGGKRRIETTIVNSLALLPDHLAWLTPNLSGRARRTCLPGLAPPQTAQNVHYLLDEKEEREALASCHRYSELLEMAVKAFLASFS